MKNKRRILAATLCSSMVLTSLSGSAYAAESTTKYVDGTYEGTATVNMFNYDITVAVEVADGKISKVSYTEDSYNKITGSNKGFADMAMDGSNGMAAKIVEHNGTEGVDVVSNATYSSNAIKQAVENAVEGKEIVENGADAVRYVLMNIPYDKFYNAEVGKKLNVDVVSSATKNKTRGSLSYGSYHTQDGSEITGATYAVKMTKKQFEKLKELDYKEITDSDKVDVVVSGKDGDTTTTYEGKDALFEAPSYAYYVLKDAPNNYKVLEISEDGSLSFKKATGDIVKTTAEATFLTTSSYGDYQLNISNLPYDTNTSTVYGAVIKTKDNSAYGLKHLENIWRKGGQLAWSVGHKTVESHGNTLSYVNYADMEGKTITGIVFYTSEGIFDMTLEEEAFVKPYIKENVTVDVLEDNKTIKVNNFSTEVKNAVATVSYREGRTQVSIGENLPVKNSSIILPEAFEFDRNVEYTVRIASDNYADISSKLLFSLSKDEYSVNSDETTIAEDKSATFKTVVKVPEDFSITEEGIHIQRFEKLGLAKGSDYQITVNKISEDAEYEIVVKMISAIPGKYEIVVNDSNNKYASLVLSSEIEAPVVEEPEKEIVDQKKEQIDKVEQNAQVFTTDNKASSLNASVPNASIAGSVKNETAPANVANRVVADKNKSQVANSAIKSVKTGDINGMISWTLSLLIACGIYVLGVAFKRRKEQ